MFARLFKSKDVLTWIISFLVAGFLVGCSSLKTYSDAPTKNLTVVLDENSDSGVEGRADIHLLDKRCQGPYQGSSWFDKSAKSIGIQENRQTLVSLKYLLSGWLTGKHSITTDVLIKARPGYYYEAKLSYIDSAYETFLYEINRRTGKRKPINIRGIHGCVEG